MEGIYVFGNKTQGWYKIGMSKNIDSRMKDIQTGVPFELVKVASWPCRRQHLAKLEKHVLTHFKGKQISGEWFQLTEEDLQECGKVVEEWKSKHHDTTKGKAIPQERKVELTAEQKQYSGMLREIEEKLEKKRKQLEKLKVLEDEVDNLKATKKNLEALLASKPAPAGWDKFVEYVHVYHHYYYPSYPWYPVINPWWTYTISGGYLVYPQQTTIYISSGNTATAGNTVICNGGPNNWQTYNSGNLNSSNAIVPSCVINTNSGSLPSDSISLTTSTSGLTLNGGSLTNGATCSSISSNLTAAPVTSYFMNVNPASAEEAKNSLESVGFLNGLKEAEIFLTNIGFIDTITN